MFLWRSITHSGNKFLAENIRYFMLLDFLIGSSWLVFVHFFFSVFFNIPADRKNYSDQEYAIIAPFYLGVLNMVGKLVSKSLGLKGIQTVVLTTLLSVTGVSIFVYFQNSYQDLDWSQYIPRLLIKHFVSYLISDYLISKID